MWIKVNKKKNYSIIQIKRFTQHSTTLPPLDHLMIDKWIMMRYLEHLLLTYRQHLMYLLWLSFCETRSCSLFLSALKMIQDYFQIENKEPRLGHLTVFGRYYFWSPTGLNTRTPFVQISSYVIFSLNMEIIIWLTMQITLRYILLIKI